MTSVLTHCDCGFKLKVTETVNGDDTIYRMRKCVPCQWVIVTEEKVAAVQMIPYKYREAKRKKST